MKIAYFGALVDRHAVLSSTFITVLYSVFLWAIRVELKGSISSWKIFFPLQIHKEGQQMWKLVLSRLSIKYYWASEPFSPLDDNDWVTRWFCSLFFLPPPPPVAMTGKDEKFPSWHMFCTKVPNMYSWGGKKNGMELIYCKLLASMLKWPVCGMSWSRGQR